MVAYVVININRLTLTSTVGGMLPYPNLSKWSQYEQHLKSVNSRILWQTMLDYYNCVRLGVRP